MTSYLSKKFLHSKDRNVIDLQSSSIYSKFIPVRFFVRVFKFPHKCANVRTVVASKEHKDCSLKMGSIDEGGKISVIFNSNGSRL